LPRFHQRIEGHRDSRDGRRLNTGTSDIIRAYRLEPIPGLTPESYEDYGADNATTALDMRPTIRGRARRNPVVLMGCWTNMAEIAVGTGYERYTMSITWRIEPHLLRGCLPERTVDSTEPGF
jgi:hypothetical protein